MPGKLFHRPPLTTSWRIEPCWGRSCPITLFLPMWRGKVSAMDGNCRPFTRRFQFTLISTRTAGPAWVDGQKNYTSFEEEEKRNIHFLSVVHCQRECNNKSGRNGWKRSGSRHQIRPVPTSWWPSIHREMDARTGQSIWVAFQLYRRWCK